MGGSCVRRFERHFHEDIWEAVLWRYLGGSFIMMIWEGTL